LKLELDILQVTLPEGKTQVELIVELAAELADTNFMSSLHGLNVKINGRITTAMAMMLGHKLAHICKSVSIYDPKEKEYILAIWH